MFNQWQVTNVGFTGGNLTYISHNSAGAEILVSTTAYPGCGIVSGTLRTARTAIGDAYVCLRPSDAGGLDSNGYAFGQIQATSEQLLNRGDDGDLQNTAPMNWGITAMQSAKNLTLGVTCYAFMADTVNYGNFYRLCKMTDGPSNSFGGSLASTYTLLATTPSLAWSIGTVHNMSLTWFSDPYFLKGTWLEAVVNNTLIFSIVHTGLDAIVSTTSEGQSIYATGGTNVGVIQWTKTALRKGTVTSINGNPYPPI